MVNDLRFSIGLLDGILAEARREDLSFSDRAGLYAALRQVEADIIGELEEKGHKAGSYPREKLFKFCWHASAALGFDVDNDHPASEHIVGALGQLNTLKTVLKL